LGGKCEGAWGRKLHSEVSRDCDPGNQGSCFALEKGMLGIKHEETASAVLRTALFLD